MLPLGSLPIKTLINLLKHGDFIVVFLYIEDKAIRNGKIFRFFRFYRLRNFRNLRGLRHLPLLWNKLKGTGCRGLA